MTGSIEERNKAIVSNAFEALFNRRDLAVAEAFFSPNYIQHNAHIPAGRKPARADCALHHHAGMNFQEFIVVTSHELGV